MTMSREDVASLLEAEAEQLEGWARSLCEFIPDEVNQPSEATAMIARSEQLHLIAEAYRQQPDQVAETLRQVMQALRATDRVTSRAACELASKAQRALMQAGLWP